MVEAQGWKREYLASQPDDAIVMRFAGGGAFSASSLTAGFALPNLGLVIIDEEQWFGVKHKEVFKRWRAHVDMLSMSATPIPRTLYMALTGARDLSVIETAPTNRHPIQTMVKTYDEKIVVDAIRFELRACSANRARESQGCR